MSNYSLAVTWSGKDALAPGAEGKVVSGADFDTEFTAVKVAVNSKADLGGAVGQNFSCNGLTATSGTVAGSQIATLGVSQEFSETQYTLAETVVLDAPQAINTTDSNVFILDVQGTYDLSLDNLAAGMELTFIIKNTGSFDITFSADFAFSGGSNPLITSGVGKVDLIRGVSDGTSLYCTISTDLV